LLLEFEDVWQLVLHLAYGCDTESESLRERFRVSSIRMDVTVDKAREKSMAGFRVYFGGGLELWDI
jgi:hypothetical protein